MLPLGMTWRNNLVIYNYLDIVWSLIVKLMGQLQWMPISFIVTKESTGGSREPLYYINKTFCIAITPLEHNL